MSEDIEAKSVELWEALEEMDVQRAISLINEGAQNMEKVDDDGSITPLLYALEQCANQGIAEEKKERLREIVQAMMEKDGFIDVTKQDRYTWLCYAVGAKNTELVKFLINKGVDNGIIPGGNSTPLMYAAGFGNMEILKFMLEQPGFVTNVNDKAIDGRTALYLAAHEGKLEAVKLLMDKGAENTQNDSGQTPFLSAISSGKVDVAKVMLQKDGFVTSVNEKDLHGYTALYYVVAQGNLEAVKLLMAKGAENTPDNSRQTPFMAAAKVSNIEILQFMFEQSGFVKDVNEQDAHGDTALLWATERKNLEAVKLLMSKGAENTPNNLGRTPLMIAVELGNIEILKFMFEQARFVMNVNEQDTSGYTALLCATAEENLEAVKLLMSKGAKNTPNDSGQTPLMLAAEKGNVEILELMLEQPEFITSVNDKDRSSCTALLHAAEEGNLEAVKLLIAKGASNIVNNYERTPFIAALSCGHTEIVQAMLEQDGFEISQEEKNAALFKAIELENVELAQLLIDQGAENALNAEGQTPLLYVLEQCADPNITKDTKERLREIVQAMMEKDGFIQQNIHAQNKLGGTALYYTIHLENNAELVHLLIDNGAMDVVNLHGDTVFIDALYWSSNNVIDAMIEATRDGQSIIDLKHQNSLGNTALHYAITHSHRSDVAIKLLALGAENIPNKKGQTPFMDAAKFGIFDVVKTMLEKDGFVENINAQTQEGSAALHFAVTHNNLEVVKLLMANGALNVPNNKGQTPLMVAAEEGNIEILELMFEQQGFATNVNEQDRAGCTALLCAAEEGKLEAVKLLMAQGALNVPNDKGQTPFMIAVEQGNIEIIQAMLEQDEFEIGAEEKNAALFKVINLGSVELAQLLIEKGAENALNAEGKTPLIQASEIMPEVVEAMLKKESFRKSINEMDQYGYTALYYTYIMHTNIKNMQLLAEHGAWDLKSITYMYKRQECKEIINTMLNSKYNLTMKDLNDKTSLAYTIDEPDLTKLLLAKGALDVQNKHVLISMITPEQLQTLLQNEGFVSLLTPKQLEMANNNQNFVSTLTSDQITLLGENIDLISILTDEQLKILIEHENFISKLSPEQVTQLLENQESKEMLTLNPLSQFLTSKQLMSILNDEQQIALINGNNIVKATATVYQETSEDVEIVESYAPIEFFQPAISDTEVLKSKDEVDAQQVSLTNFEIAIDNFDNLHKTTKNTFISQHQDLIIHNMLGTRLANNFNSLIVREYFGLLTPANQADFVSENLYIVMAEFENLSDDIKKQILTSSLSNILQNSIVESIQDGVKQDSLNTETSTVQQDLNPTVNAFDYNVEVGSFLEKNSAMIIEQFDTLGTTHQKTFIEQDVDKAMSEFDKFSPKAQKQIVHNSLTEILNSKNITDVGSFLEKNSAMIIEQFDTLDTVHQKAFIERDVDKTMTEFDKFSPKAQKQILTNSFGVLLKSESATAVDSFLKKNAAMIIECFDALDAANQKILVSRNADMAMSQFDSFPPKTREKIVNNAFNELFAGTDKEVTKNFISQHTEMIFKHFDKLDDTVKQHIVAEHFNDLNQLYKQIIVRDHSTLFKNRVDGVEKYSDLYNSLNENIKSQVEYFFDAAKRLEHGKITAPIRGYTNNLMSTSIYQTHEQSEKWNENARVSSQDGSQRRDMDTEFAGIPYPRIFGSRAEAIWGIKIYLSSLDSDQYDYVMSKVTRSTQNHTSNLSYIPTINTHEALIDTLQNLYDSEYRDIVNSTQSYQQQQNVQQERRGSQNRSQGI